MARANAVQADHHRQRFFKETQKAPDIQGWGATNTDPLSVRAQTKKTLRFTKKNAALIKKSASSVHHITNFMRPGTAQTKKNISHAKKSSSFVCHIVSFVLHIVRLVHQNTARTEKNS
jgi:L-alanine-DL-glutamate epimerase-like enolase superfamily enzyme